MEQMLHKNGFYRKYPPLGCIPKIPLSCLICDLCFLHLSGIEILFFNH